MTGFTLRLHGHGRCLSEHRIDAGAIQLGRDRSCAVVLPHRAISPRHAELVLVEGGVRLTDLASASGTFVDGQRVKSTVLRAGDSFSLGPYTVHVSSAERPAPRSTAAVPPRREAPAARGLEGFADLIGVSDLKAVLETLLDRTSQLFAARRGFVVLVEDGRLTPILASHGTSPGSDGLSQTVCQDALRSRRAVVLAGPADIGRFPHAESLVAARSETVVAVPLLDEDRAMGVLYVESDRLPPGSAHQTREVLAEVGSLGGRALALALERRELVAARDRWRSLAVSNRDAVDVFAVARSPAMRHALELTRRVAAQDVTVLITGESGTGKEVVARAIHDLSARRAHPFVAVNCGAIPKDLVESHLFGHEKGAFTGADTRKLGKLELAMGGTLLLDELGELPLEVQVKLLRVLETRTFERVGGHELIPWNARVLAATNRLLEDDVASGSFRADLYYRLNVVQIALPALRDRPEDLQALVDEFVRQANLKFARRVIGPSPAARRALAEYRWPGNVRELKNVIERAFILEEEQVLSPEAFRLTPVPTAPVEASAPVAPTEPAGTTDPVPTLAEFLAAQEARYIRFVLERVGGNLTQAARLMGVARSVLYRRLEALGLRVPGSD